MNSLGIQSLHNMTDVNFSLHIKEVINRKQAVRKFIIEYHTVSSFFYSAIYCRHSILNRVSYFPDHISFRTDTYRNCAIFKFTGFILKFLLKIQEDIPDFTMTLKSGWQMVVPLVVLVYLLAIGKSAQYSALIGIIFLIAVAACRQWTRMNGREILHGFTQGVKDSIGISITAAAAGIIIGGVTNTGVNLLFANQIVKISHGNMFFSLLMVAITCLVLGMGMTTSAVYISVATIMAPALIKLGINPLCAHMFVLYYGCICVITPPVALASFTAAGISGASPSKTGWTSFRIGLVAFLVPFIFVYQPVMLLYGSVADILLCTGTSLIGCWCLAAMIEGWCDARLSGIERVLFGAGGLLLMIPGIMTDCIGIVLVVVPYFIQRKRMQKEVVA